ncbi:reverse transcriptase domain-containing protein, partial [Tanacetum coccineum]
MKWVLCVQWLRLAVTGLGLGLQSLHSLCQLHTNGLLKLIEGPFGLHSLHNYTIGLSRPIRWVKIASNSILQFRLRKTRELVRRNHETIGELNGQENNQGVEANGGVDRVPDFSTIIAQQLQNLLPTLLAQVGNQGNNQENKKNQNDNAVNGNTQGDDRNVIIEKMELVQDMSGCGDNQKLKYTAEVKAGTLTDEAISNGSLKKNTEKRGNGGEPSRDRNVKDDNKRTRTWNAFATIANLVRRKYTGTTPKCTNCNLYHLLESPCRACFSCNRLGHLAKDYIGVPRMANPMNARNPTAARGACFECGGTDHFKAACPRLNQAQRPGGGCPNQVVAIDEGQGRENNGNQARRGAFMLGFVSTAFTPLLGIESSNLGFSYEIEIASGQLVEIDKVIRGCKLEIEGHTFDIDLIPFGSGSFDVIVGMDWLSKHKAEIIFHEKVVWIPLRNGKTLRVICERPEEKVRHLRSAKSKEQKKEDIVV